MSRGWQQRDSRSAMLLQVERAGIEQPKVIPIDERPIRSSSDKSK